MWVRPILVARGNQASRIPYSSPLSSGFLLSLPSHGSGSAEGQYWGLALGLDLDLIWILTGTCVLFASVHCVISRPVLAGLGETLMTAFLWRSARNASERLHPHHTHTTHVHQPRCSRAQTVWTAGHLLERGTSVSDSRVCVKGSLQTKCCSRTVHVRPRCYRATQQ